MVVNGVDIEVERKPIKNLHLAVYPPDGRVHVSAPQSYTDEQIKLFVLKKWIWLVQKRKETTSYIFQNEREYVSGEAHYYKGELYRLKVIRDNTCTFHVEIQGDYINVYVYERTTKENIANILWNWYKEQNAEIHGTADRRCPISAKKQSQTWKCQDERPDAM